VIRELVRITAPGGHILLQAWAQEQDEASRYDFKSNNPNSCIIGSSSASTSQEDSSSSSNTSDAVNQDVLVPWRLQKRFCDDQQADKYIGPGDAGAGAVDGTAGKKKVKKTKRKKRLAIEQYLATQQEKEGDVLVDDDNSEVVAVEEADNKDATPEVVTIDNGNELQNAQQLTQSVPSSDDAVDQNAAEEQDIDGECQHAVDEGNQVVFQRYCHVYKAGELEDLCSR
jgi:hypothetical protein